MHTLQAVSMYRLLTIASIAAISILPSFADEPTQQRHRRANHTKRTDASTNRPTVAKRSAPDVPPALTEYMGREIAKTMHYSQAPWLTRESRQREEDCETMIEQLRLQPGMTVADIGCGNGFYAIRLAKLVGDRGKVLAVDIQPEMLRLLKSRAGDEELHNIETIASTVIDPQLPAGQLDLILCVDVYHEFSHPVQMLAAMRDALKPNGQLVLAEFRSEDPAVPIKPLHKMSKSQVLKELSSNGFELTRAFNELPWQHLLFFEQTRVEANEK